jgi:hypothetical protein
LLTFAFAPLLGCMPDAKPPVLSEGGHHVYVGKEDPPRGAHEIGPLTVSDGDYCSGPDGTYQHALVRLRNRAATKGANYLELMTVTEPHQDTRFCYDHEFVIRAMAYVLPPAREAQEAEAETDACDPPCSPGYTCNAGTCDAVCNPACATNQVCRADRTCGPADGAAPSP